MFSSGPSSVPNIVPTIDSTNVTLEWPRPEGRIETYALKWWLVDNPDSTRSKNVSGSSTSVFDENTAHAERVLIDELMPGVRYMFTVLTYSYGLTSDLANLTVRTSECFVVFCFHFIIEKK